MENVIKKLFVAMLLCLMQTAVCTADTFKGKIVNAERARFSSEQRCAAR